MKNIFLCFVAWTQFGAPLLVPSTVTSKRGGFDERFNASEPVVVDYRRYMDIQQKVRALENPCFSITSRADMAKEWLELDRIRPPNPTLRLWEAWLLTAKSRDDDVTTSPPTLFSYPW